MSAKREIQVITNNMGSGDWVVVKYNTDTIFEGHRISPRDLVDIINTFYSNEGAELVEVTDEQMEQGDY
jgi:hypothetical protein